VNLVKRVLERTEVLRPKSGQVSLGDYVHPMVDTARWLSFHGALFFANPTSERE
jgi:hypothetical protein